MGTGKSTVGLLLAEELGWPFLDTDHLIEARAGRTVPEIFTQEGEAAFRALEKTIIAEVCAQSPVVVATGGGAIMDEANLGLMQQESLLVALTASPKTICDRVTQGADPAERPLLAGSDPMKAILRLIEERQASYDKADYVVDTSEKSPEQIAQAILEYGALRADR